MQHFRRKLQSADRANGYAGFTVTELMVTIAVLAILLGITLPALRGARKTASETKSLANLRTIGQTLTAYTSQYDGRYPFGQAGWIVPPGSGDPFAVGFEIWLIDRNWPTLLHKVAPWGENFGAWLSPGSERSRLSTVPGIGGSEGVESSGYLPSYYYSTSFVADGAIWDPGANATETLIGPTLHAGVSYPANKVIMLDVEMNYLSTSDETTARPLLLTDGSAQTGKDQDALEYVQNSLSAYAPRPYHDTLRGTRGRDVP